MLKIMILIKIKFFLTVAFSLSVLRGCVNISSCARLPPRKVKFFSGQLLRNCVESLSFRSCLRCPCVCGNAFCLLGCSNAPTMTNES